MKMQKNDALKERLARSSEITITVTGRKSGRAISNPVWFALDGDDVYLLPVKGSETEWYKNVLKNPVIRIKAGNTEGDFEAVSLTEPKRVSSVVERFRHNYGANDVKKYYSKLDVAVLAHMR